MLNATKWTIDPAHSDLQFKVKHLGVFTVAGNFKKFQGNAYSETGNFAGSKINLTIEADSIDTNHPDRDAHLKSADFFNTEKFPHVVFTGALDSKEDESFLTGDLTIGETTQPVRLDATYLGVVKGRFGETRAGFEVEGKINRKAFGLVWNLLMETGGVIVGEEVKLHFQIQLIKEA